VLTALLMALLIAGTVTAVLYSHLRKLVTDQRKVTQIVAAAHDLRSGVTLTVKDLTLVDWPTDVSFPGSFSKISDVVGHPLIYSLGAKEPVLERELGVEGSGLGLSARIPDGMRATAVRSNEIVGVAGFLYPGSYVDVLATYNTPGSGILTETVLQDVEVLTAGQTVEPDPQGKPQSVNVVTLLLSSEDSQKLLLASSQGSIQFVLRSGVDKERVDLTPTRLEQLVPSAKPVAPFPSPKRIARPPQPPPVAPDVYTLEVIQGTQRNTQKF
jgi:pilus assembly protein CpaB